MGYKLILAELGARIVALEQRAFGRTRRRLSKKQLAEQEACSTREVMRRVARGIYSQPEVENGRLYWWSDSYRRVPATADTPEARAARNPRLRKPTQAAEAR